MAAAHEWLNALAAGSEVQSIRRREPTRRPLNVPRPLLTKRGLEPYHHSSPEEHAATLRTPRSRRTHPETRGRAVAPRRSRGRFRVDEHLNGADQVICATGFREGYAHDPLLARLVAEHDLPTHDRWIVLAPDSTVAALTDDTRTLALAGVAGQWAFPAADTIAGAKYAARAFTRRVCRSR